MIELSAFVDEIALKIAELTPADFVSSDQVTPLEARIIIKLGLDTVSRRFAAIVGPERVNEFYQGYEPKIADASFHLGTALARLIPSYCQVSQDGHIGLDSERLLRRLCRIADAIQSGRLDYSICLRVANIDIDDDFELARGIRFRKLPRELVQSRYPIERQFTPVSPILERYWPDHRVEVVIPGRGTPADLQQQFRIEQCDALANSILHTFLVADIPPQTRPFVTHVVIDSPIEGQCDYRGVNGLCFRPPLLALEDIAILQKTYAFLVDVVHDRVLQTAVDRFVLGKKKNLHHPNRTNEPHWDKVVDYVIAMETLFLTVDGKAAPQELAYRFRLNGASVLRKSAGGSIRRYFHSLKHLYDLRSKVVHGCDDSTIVKCANKFIGVLQIDCPSHKHALGRLMLIAKQVEEWLTNVLFYLGSLHITERPYRKQDGWEEMLWQSPPEDHPTH